MLQASALLCNRLVGGSAYRLTWQRPLLIGGPSPPSQAPATVSAQNCRCYAVRPCAYAQASSVRPARRASGRPAVLPFGRTGTGVSAAALTRRHRVSTGRLSGSRQAHSVAVLADVSHGKLGESTLSVVTAAKKLSTDVTVLVVGDCDKAVASARRISGIRKVLTCKDKALQHMLAEPTAAFLASVMKEKKFTYLLSSASSDAKNVLPRLAAMLDVQAISDVSQIKDEKTFVRPIYAGNVIATVESSQDTNVLTIRTTHFPKSELQTEEVDTEDVPYTAVKQDVSRWHNEELSKSERPELGSAKVVVSGGRGLKSGDNFKLLYELADTLGGAVGASRAAVDAGYVPNELQVGQTGKIVAPELYIAAGISGAIQHLAGMKDSKCIVAINKDPEAPIFQVADFGLVADLFDVMPKLTAKVKEAKQK